MSKEIEIQRIVEDESLNLHPLARLFLLLLCLSIVGLLIAPFAYFPLRQARIKSVTERMKGPVRRDFRAFIGGPATYLDCHPVGRKGGVTVLSAPGIASARKGGVEGKRMSVRVNLGGRSVIKK